MRKALAILSLSTCIAVGGGPSAGAKPPIRFHAETVDRSVDPCVDFYRFTCARWRKAYRLRKNQPDWNRFHEVYNRNRAVLRAILEGARRASSARSPIEAKVGDYYAACMDEGAIESKGMAPIQPLFARIAGVESKKAFFRLLGQLDAEGLPVLFTFESTPDLHDSGHMIAEVEQDGLGLPDRDDYSKVDARSREKREKYVEHVARMLELAGTSAQQARADAAVVMQVETALAGAHLSRVAMRDPRNWDSSVTLGELEALTPAFEWTEYLSGTGAPAISRINLRGRGYFVEGNATIKAASLDSLKTYLRWHVVDAAAPFLGAAFVNENFRYSGTYLQGTSRMDPRWTRCVWSTDQALGDALGRLFVEKTFAKSSQTRARAMIAALHAALRESIEAASWITVETRLKALEKVAALGARKVGHPDVWEDYAAVEVRRDDYFGNWRRASTFEIARDRLRIGKPTDRTLWWLTPPTVSAYYSRTNNEIVVPAGILQPPFFDPGLDEAVNFGAIGMVIGHEYTHALDDAGRHFDADGNLADWWTAADLTAFEERTDCYAAQYDAYVSVTDRVNGNVRLNGRLTLGENVADNAGLRVAYRALQKALAGAPRANVDGFTPEQRFFLGFANMFCENMRDELARQLAQVDAHSRAEFRVNGTLGNMSEFAEAFGCKAHQPMVRENACRVW